MVVVLNLLVVNLCRKEQRSIMVQTANPTCVSVGEITSELGLREKKASKFQEHPRLACSCDISQLSVVPGVIL